MQAKQSNLCIEIGELRYDAEAETVLSTLASQNETLAVSGGTQQTQRIVDSHIHFMRKCNFAREDGGIRVVGGQCY